MDQAIILSKALCCRRTRPRHSTRDVECASQKQAFQNSALLLLLCYLSLLVDNSSAYIFAPTTVNFHNGSLATIQHANQRPALITNSTLNTTNANSGGPKTPKPIIFKFTLIAGKYWKFNLKQKTFQSFKDVDQLRLHRTQATGRNLIDDDGWFQFKQQQLQLLAWPPLSTQTGMYEFFLLPAGHDVESLGNEMNNEFVVVASIVVQVIKPVYLLHKEIDNLLDHRFSLDYLHRHANYPLLLDQVVALFDVLAAAKSSSNSRQLSSQISTTAALTNLSNNNKTDFLRDEQRQVRNVDDGFVVDRRRARQRLAAAADFTAPTNSTSLEPTLNNLSLEQTNSITTSTRTPQQNQQQQQQNYTSTQKPTAGSQPQSAKLSDFLLVDTVPTRDGSLFSLAWSTHRLLIQNTLAPIADCRLDAIFDIITKLSAKTSRATLKVSYNNNNQATIYYPLESHKISELSKQIIVLTERGNFSLKLVLNKPCLDQRYLDQLVTSDPISLYTTSRPASITTSTTTLPPQTFSNFSIVNSSIPPPTSPTLPPNFPSSTTNESYSEFNTNKIIISIDNSTFDDSLNVKSVTSQSDDNTTSLISLFDTTELPTSKDSHSTEANNFDLSSDLPTGEPDFKNISLIELDQPVLDRYPLEDSNNSITSNPQSNSTILSIDSNQILSIDTNNHRSFKLDNSETMDSNSTQSQNTTTAQLSVASNSSTSTSASTNSALSDLSEIFANFSEDWINIAAPILITIGGILAVCIVIALISLCIKRKKVSKFDPRSRFDFKYGSERRAFLKNSSKPVILEADQRSLSMGGTPQHRAKRSTTKSPVKQNRVVDSSTQGLALNMLNGNDCNKDEPTSGDKH